MDKALPHNGPFLLETILQNDAHSLPLTDSRQVKPGDLFLAIPCAAMHEHIEQAINQGAKTIIIKDTEAPLWQNRYPFLKIIPTPNPRLTLALLAKNLYPEQPDKVIAVTGTNGKSSVVHLIRQLWLGCGLSAASLGTLGLVTNQGQAPDLPLPALTTLDSVHMHQALTYLKNQGIQCLALEASSHGLDQYRIHGVDLQAAGFTNFTQDHLDYHSTMEHYFASKAKLFTEVLAKGKTAVLNGDSPYFGKLKKLCQERQQAVLSYSLTQKADLWITNIQQKPQHLEFDLYVLGQAFIHQYVPLVGKFQLENLLCALGLCLATTGNIDDLIKTLPLLQPVKGRMQLIGSYHQAAIFVDYAHTPDALETALKNLRPHTQGQLWVVFGCGGNRDQAKRPRMGEVANLWADQVIITDDNPRYENAAHIRQQILATCPKAKEIGDRRYAIRSTIAQLQPGDIVLVAGKGHETSQIIGDIIYPFCDQNEIETFLQELTHG